MDCGSVMARFRSVFICFIAFFVLSPNESEVIIDLGCSKREIIYPID